MRATDATTLRTQARRLEGAGDIESATGFALHAFASDPHHADGKQLAARLIKRGQAPISVAFAEQVHALLTDPDVNPRKIERAGWRLLHAAGSIPTEAEAAAHWLEQNVFARTLLSESHVTLIEVERALTALRRWLLLSDRAADFPNAVAALVEQADRNSGAWLFDEEEAAYLDDHGEHPLRLAYVPERPAPVDTPDYASPVTRAVAGQYDRWPYPAWRRATAGRQESFKDAVAAIARDAPQDMPDDARLLIAGCGTGLQAMTWAQRYPRLRITAIDISASALDYAEARRPDGLDNLRFERCDLHDAGHLGTFDAIVATGVLHHLPNPEAGWAALTHLLGRRDAGHAVFRACASDGACASGPDCRPHGAADR